MSRRPCDAEGRCAYASPAGFDAGQWGREAATASPEGELPRLPDASLAGFL